MDLGISDFSVTTSLLTNLTFVEVFVAWFNMAVLGYGIGTVPGPTGGGGIGVRHTSGMPIQFPPADVEPGNIAAIAYAPSF
jgi:hypothetical protein